jgi:DNA mismatch repair protein MSH5
MQQVSQALQSSTRRSLVLLDEMGKGTSSTDGASLFAATIKHFLRRGEDCPRILAATHFHGECVTLKVGDSLAQSLPSARGLS